MIAITAQTGIPILLGRQGEHLATEVCFPLAPLAEAFGDGEAILTFRRSGDEDGYPIQLRRSGRFAYWAVTSSDTAHAGRGECELRWYVGQTLAKSCLYRTVTEAALCGEAAPPDPWKSWVDTVTEAAAHAPYISENGTWQTWNSDESAYEDTGFPSRGAQGEKGEKGDCGEDGNGVPAGGAAGYFLKKNSSADFDASWSPLPKATKSEYGGVKVADTGNIGIVFTGSDQLRISPATAEYIDGRNNPDLPSGDQSAVKYRPICPATLDYAAVKALTTNSIRMTEEQRSQARNWLGIRERDLLLSGQGAPTEHTPGVLGQFYIATSAEDDGEIGYIDRCALYLCTAVHSDFNDDPIPYRWGWTRIV